METQNQPVKESDLKEESDLREESSSKEESVPNLVPDGGTRAWCTVAGGWLSIFVTWGYSNAFGVYQDYYTRSGTSSPSNISWIGSIQLFFFFTMSLPAGKLFDMGYFRHLMLLGTFFYIFSIFMLSLADPHKYYQLLLSQGIGTGIGQGLMYLPTIAVQAHHWTTRRSLAMGIVATGSAAGGIVYPIMLNHFLYGPLGFAWGTRVLAFFSLVLLIASNCLMSTRPSPIKKSSVNTKAVLRDILTDSPYILMILGLALVLWGLYFASCIGKVFYLQLFSVLHGLPSNFSYDTLTVQNAASFVGRVIPNILADRLGVTNVLIVMSIGSGVMVLSLFGKVTIGHVLVFSILYGFLSGAVLSLSSPMLAALARDVNEVGLRMGIAFFVFAFAFLTGTPIDGAFLDNGYSWYKPIIFSGVVILAGPVLFAVARVTITRRRQTQRV